MKSKCRKNNHQKPDKDHQELIVSCLWDGPLTLEEIQKQHSGLMHRFGVFDHQVIKWSEGNTDWQQEVLTQVNEAVKNGYIQLQVDRYELTDSGRTMAAKVIEDYRKMGRILQRLGQPEMVSRISFWAGLALALLKLPAALLSGSVALLNDALDTLIDGVSNLLMLAGIRFKQPKLTNAVLAALMLVTGFYTFYIAMQRFFFPVIKPFSIFAWVATLASALVFGLLSMYQRYIGLKSGNLALITQSKNSRNHFFVAGSVVVALVGSTVGLSFPDNIVALFVAVMITRRAVELTWEIWRSEDEFGPELHHYNMFFADKVTNWQERHFLLWLLYLVDVQNMTTQKELLEECQRGMDFSGNIVLRESGLVKNLDVKQKLDAGLEKLSENGWLNTLGSLSITQAGKEQLKGWI